MTVVFYDAENMAIKKTILNCVCTLPNIEEIIDHRVYYTRVSNEQALNDLFQDVSSTIIKVNKPSGVKGMKSAKNFLDFHIFADALRLAYTKNEIETFVFVSHDSDFLVLADHLVNMNKKVLVLKKESFTIHELSKKTTVPSPMRNSTYIKHKITECSKQPAKKTQTFDSRLNGVLDACIKCENFHSILVKEGINISSLHSIIKSNSNKFMYKQTGEKKMHLAFAKALVGSRFCVIQKDSLFYVTEHASVSDNSVIVTFDENAVDITTSAP